MTAGRAEPTGEKEDGDVVPHLGAGDGRPDILDKPYNWDTPRVDVWLQRLAPR